IAPLELARALEPVLAGRGRRLAAPDHGERSRRWVALEVEDVLARLRLPAPGSVLHHHAVAQRLDRQAREGHRGREVALQLLQRPGEGPRRNLGVGERLRGAQHDQILEREPPGLARASHGRDEAGVDQALDGAAGEVKQALDVADAVGMRCGVGSRDYLLAAFLGAGSACCARLGALRDSSAALAGAGAFFLSRLARSASIRSMTSAPPSGASTMVISSPSTFFCTGASAPGPTPAGYVAASCVSAAVFSLSSQE